MKMFYIMFIAAAYGDPHFQTFGGTKYTFNGKGEYYVLRTTSGSGANEPTVEVATRFEKPG